MSTLYDFSRKVHELSASKQYNEALLFFKTNKAAYGQQEIAANPYLMSDMLSNMRHIKAFSAAYKFMDLYGVQLDEATPERILTAYAWLLYDHFKAENSSSNLEETKNKFETEAEESVTEFNNIDNRNLILRIEPVLVLLQTSESKYRTTVLEFLFKLVLKVEIKALKPDWQLVIRFCDSVKPEFLGTECKTIQLLRKGQLKDMELASTREEWYAHLSKALYQTNQYNRCMEISKQALESFDKFHYSNDIWFARRMALCLKKLGNTQEAIESLEKLLRKKREWFILKELSELYFEKGEDEKALRYAKEAMNAYGPITFKVELIEMLGDMLLKSGEKGLGYKHYIFARHLRELEKWHVDKMLQDKIEAFEKGNVHLPIDEKEAEAELKRYWGLANPLENRSKKALNLKVTSGTKITGSITKLLTAKKAGVDGFVKPDKGETVYFFIPKTHEIYKELHIGMRLEFEKVAAQNGKGDKAIHIKLAKL